MGNHKATIEKLIKDLEELTRIKDSDVKIFLEETKNILNNTLEIDDTIDWELLKDTSKFDKRKPKTPEFPTKPKLKGKPKKKSISVKKEITLPKLTDKKYELKLSFFDRIFKKRSLKKKEYQELIFRQDIEAAKESNSIIKLENERAIKNEEESYLKRVESWENENKNKIKEWENECKKISKKYDDECKKINDERELFYQERKKINELIDIFKIKYSNLETEAIEQYCNLVLSNSIYPSSFPQSFELEYSKNNKSLIVDYRLPTLEDLPKVKEVKFFKSKKEIKEIPLSQSEINKLFDSSIYQICLRTIHELIEADSVNAIDMVTFNGFVKFINKANGKEENSCIISLQVSKEEFISINLSRVEPKDCFKGLKGVGSSKLHGLSAIKPILDMDRSDSRIAESYSVVGDLDDSVNLAMMDWEDFENLVRELFAKEFTNEGAEVHVTQASRDGGVDAIAFDPDPIRGGKMVIQAKRYTNVVGVSAVRDLYGTVVNEGAIKGILVTTADYGPDAYKFAKDKPLTLLNGNNLLHMLMKHGTKAKIDIKEAKKYFKENSEK